MIFQGHVSAGAGRGHGGRAKAISYLDPGPNRRLPTLPEKRFLVGVLAMLTLAVAVHAQFNVHPESDGTVTLGKYKGKSRAVSVPATVGGRSVTRLAATFCSFASLTNVTMPDCVTDIGNVTFYGCGDLAGISIGNGVTNIGRMAFAKCSSLKNVTIPDRVSHIDAGAFSHCSSLTSVTIPAGVRRIGDYAFAHCSALTNVCFRGNAPKLSKDVFDGDSKATIYYLPGATGWGPTFGNRPTAARNPLGPVNAQAPVTDDTATHRDPALATLPAPLVHFRFDGNARNEGTSKARCELPSPRFVDNALYADGKYGGKDTLCTTPELDYSAFTVIIRFKTSWWSGDLEKDYNSGHGKRANLLTGGTSCRWFDMYRNPTKGNLIILLNNGGFGYEMRDALLCKDTWTVVACSVDAGKKKMIAYMKGQQAEAVNLPDDFAFEVVATEWKESDKIWTFSNYASATVFQGLVDELLIFGQALTSKQLEKACERWP